MLEQDVIIAELQQVKTAESLEEWFQKYLGKKWLLPAEFKVMGSLSPEEKREKWQQLSSLKTALESAYEQKNNEISSEAINEMLEKDLIDISLPGWKLDQWYYNLLAKTRREVENIAQSLWFRIDALQKYSTNVDNNVAKIDERLVWDVVPKVEQIESSTLKIKSSIDYMLDSFQN